MSWFAVLHAYAPYLVTFIGNNADSVGCLRDLHLLGQRLCMRAAEATQEGDASKTKLSSASRLGR